MASALFSCSLIAMRKAASDVEYDTQAANIDDSVGVSEFVAPGISCVSEDGPSFRAEWSSLITSSSGKSGTLLNASSIARCYRIEG
jgi:hypothetical protein